MAWWWRTRLTRLFLFLMWSRQKRMTRSKLSCTEYTVTYILTYQFWTWYWHEANNPIVSQKRDHWVLLFVFEDTCWTPTSDDMTTILSLFRDWIPSKSKNCEISWLVFLYKHNTNKTTTLSLSEFGHFHTNFGHN